MLAQARVSIVDPTPGVTRDRVSIHVDLVPPIDRLGKHEDPEDYAKTVEIVDTGGYGIYTDRDDDLDSKELTSSVEYQITQAVRTADVILFVVDAQSGILPLDETVTELLRRAGVVDSVKLIINKVDSEKWEAHAADAMSLGFEHFCLISAETGYNKREFLGLIYDSVPEQTETPAPPAEMLLAIVGKRNAGKSTLVNALAGEERVIVSHIPGTTRDSVDVRFEINDRVMIAIDTAGIRKRKSIQDDVEYYSTHRALRSIRRADVIALVIDATVDISQVDKKLTKEIQEHFKPCVIVVNKWDLVKGKKDRKGHLMTPEHYLDYITQELRGLEYCPCVFISAKESDGVKDAIALAFNLFEQSKHRETTGKLNNLIQTVLERRGPSSRLGRQAKVFYVSQVAVQPPTIVFVVNNRSLFIGQYERYLLNRLREEMAFSEVPIRLLFRDRKRASLNELKAGDLRKRRRDNAAAAAAEMYDLEFDENDEAELADLGIDPNELGSIDVNQNVDQNEDFSDYFDEQDMTDS